MVSNRKTKLHRDLYQTRRTVRCSHGVHGDEHELLINSRHIDKEASNTIIDFVSLAPIITEPLSSDELYILARCSNNISRDC